MSYSVEIDPSRLTVEVVYQDVDAPSEWDAEVDGRSLFREECTRDHLPETESIVAHAEEI